ncbi:peptidoglycan-binding protein [Streptomyces sp. RS10V-4]|uniref:peptidoglycan-binding domain-containing protein n=1 Tax=Streptomyces rhizoryzae TaxID=2932493 RepID=UPI00200576C5|nr:peptidoglycan-binding domain-containing protein [Streptomyces rhizoryzae]MCK7625368.1 peptidoglycan-binding protein [Streptomyces rhizoryzae]
MDTVNTNAPHETCATRESAGRPGPEGTAPAVRRTGLRTAAAGLLAAGLLTGPAAPAAPARPAVLAACAYYRGTAPTAPGQRGDRVKQVQCLLANHRRLAWKDVTGHFGDRTRAAVAAFQTRHRLRPTGTVDTKTWRALYS